MPEKLEPAQVTKYQVAGDIASRSIAAVLKEIKAGQKVGQLCRTGNEFIKQFSSTVYTKQKVPKGIAFPCCVSVNDIACHLSPLENDPEFNLELKDGDLVRVELGAHVDGYIAHCSETLVVGATSSNKTNGDKANVIQAAHVAAEAAARLIKPGNTNLQVSQAFDKIAADFGVVAVQGMSSQQMLKDVHDGPNEIIQNPPEQERAKIEEFTFEEGQVYSINILFSTGAGKVKQGPQRTTVFKRDPDATYLLKMKASRAVFSQIQKDCGTMVFSLTQLEDEKRARMGIVECQTHGLVKPYNVLVEQAAHLAQSGFTLLVLKDRAMRVTASQFDAGLLQAEKALQDEELKKLVAEPFKTKAKQ